ncbi:hypothetical protein F4553_005138 [Allocatelliglobosispora scoriae]|uniref:Oxidoreductase n=1 Tax=Allocatelliglobosispora scoriae TaxID=643052 RepID=A0A841BX85_9ACTN|nr:hypothetical protein [Allocatelliglobosispora scoriae]MBB5871759.1 hypothetical protein [Allocatelliglobosispora scoriae]
MLYEDLLNDAERQVWNCFARGVEVDLGGGEPAGDGFDPLSWGAEREVRGEVISRLLLGAVDSARGHVPRIFISGARIIGTVDLAGSDVDCQLVLFRCWFDDAVRLGGARLREVRLNGCRAAEINANGLRTEGALKLIGCRMGHLRLYNAHLGDLALTGSTITDHGGPAVSADGLVVEHDVTISDGFTAIGPVSFANARIGGRLVADGSVLRNPGKTALNCSNMQATALHVDSTIDGAVDLRGARISTLHLLPSPAMRNVPMLLNGLTYDDLEPDPPAEPRIAWLRRDPNGYHPQPYEQLAKYFLGLGHDRDARTVLLEKRRARRAVLAQELPLPSWLGWFPRLLIRIPGWFADALAGYGYVPWRAFFWLVAAEALGWWVFRSEPAPDHPSHSPNANAALYALDAILPTSPLGLEELYHPLGGKLVISLLLQGLGWALSFAVLPAATRALSRSDR